MALNLVTSFVDYTTCGSTPRMKPCLFLCELIYSRFLYLLYLGTLCKPFAAFPHLDYRKAFDRRQDHIPLYPAPSDVLRLWRCVSIRYLIGNLALLGGANFGHGCEDARPVESVLVLLALKTPPKPNAPGNVTVS